MPKVVKVENTPPVNEHQAKQSNFIFINQLNVENANDNCNQIKAETKNPGPLPCNIVFHVESVGY